MGLTPSDSTSQHRSDQADETDREKSSLELHPRFFPPASQASADGLLCVGGDLAPEWLLDAYGHGIFPWPVWDQQPMAWWSPDPRAVFEFEGFYVTRRLRRTVRSGRFQVSCDKDFPGVIQACATCGGRRGKTWLTSEMIDAYNKMHKLGHAHSVETWHGNQLVGGVYGIGIGGAFAAESMFHKVRDASKVALVHLVAHLVERGYKLLDIQQWTAHTGLMGATEIPRAQFLERLAHAVDLPVTFGTRLEGQGKLAQYRSR